METLLAKERRKEKREKKARLTHLQFTRQKGEEEEGYIQREAVM